MKQETEEKTRPRRRSHGKEGQRGGGGEREEGGGREERSIPVVLTDHGLPLGQ